MTAVPSNPALPLRWRRACLAGLAALLSACASAPAPADKSIAGPGGAPVAVSIERPAVATGPVVVLQSGLGDGRAPWATVAQQLAARHTVFSYDRPGYGDSASVAGPRDPCSVAAELHQLLQSAGLPPPYLLVGHSLGGLYQHAFARLYPQDVAGVLLLDPTHPDHLVSLKATSPALAGTVQVMRSVLFGAAARREFDDQAICRERLIGPPPQPLPTRLLVSTRRAPLEEGAFADMLDRLRDDWLLLTGAARVERVPDAGHYLQTDQPARVVAAIDALASPKPSPTGAVK
ncbi:alpha/beta fold hydrolase [Derxia lacustris]|uniref:alpha/beta fold hydrolase n=1 Tax=Derxia lacustris TaxID=764842 RepID=UPI001592BC5F|nr:alpha/beta fold hydrolase [Derxia lacustris]